MTLSAHEILRFGIEQASWRIAFVHPIPTTCEIGLVDHQNVRWEIIKTAQRRSPRASALRNGENPQVFVSRIHPAAGKDVSMAIWQRVLEAHRQEISRIVQQAMDDHPDLYEMISEGAEAHLPGVL